MHSCKRYFMCMLKSKNPRINLCGTLFSLSPFLRTDLIIIRQFYFNLWFSIRCDPNKLAPVSLVP